MRTFGVVCPRPILKCFDLTDDQWSRGHERNNNDLASRHHYRPQYCNIILCIDTRNRISAKMNATATATASQPIVHTSNMHKMKITNISTTALNTAKIGGGDLPKSAMKH
jgi:hypothetical protein